tara:strand:- start:2563 stop:3636 length:1074 start_codon:yes stop_codon:yes gene_type:complete
MAKEDLTRLPKGIIEGTVQKTIKSNTKDVYDKRIDSTKADVLKRRTNLIELEDAQPKLSLFETWQAATGYPGEVTGDAWEAWSAKYKPSAEDVTELTALAADQKTLNDEWVTKTKALEKAKTDLKAAQTEATSAEKAYNKAVREGDKEKIGEATKALKAANDAELDASKSFDEATANHGEATEAYDEDKVRQKTASAENEDAIKTQKKVITGLEKEVSDFENKAKIAEKNLAENTELKTENTTVLTDLGYDKLVAEIKALEAYPVISEDTSSFMQAYGGKIPAASKMKEFAVQYHQSGVAIATQIAEAALAGKFKTIYKGDIYQITLQILLDEGYQVSNHVSGGYLIKWQNDVEDKS